MWAILKRVQGYPLKTTALMICALYTAWTHAGVATDELDPQLEQHRETYRQARQALDRRQMDRYHELLEALESYPLVPYLQYQEMTTRLDEVSNEAVAEFLNRYPYSYLAERLRYRWLRKLANEKRWDAYQRFFHTGIKNTRLNCHQLEARIHTGQRDALEAVGDLWNVSYSQVKACDPLFELWMDAGYPSRDLAWQRHSKAVQAGNLHLARYIAKFLPEKDQALAALYREVDVNPERLKNQERFAAQTPAMREIILHGLKTLARHDAAKALALWERYNAQQLFEREDRLATQRHIAIWLIYQDHPGKVKQLLAQSPALSSEDLTERLIRNALRQQDWAGAYNWLNKLPESAQETERWRYWRARLMEELELTPDNGPSAKDLYSAVAATRSFYGFLSADKLGFEYRLLDRPIRVTEAQVSEVAERPGIQRAKELLVMGDLTNANREWYHATRHMDKEAIIAAGKLAERWGWYRNGIQAMISARAWNDLQVRFPLAYQELVDNAAEATSVKPHLLFAIARQESAFMPNARSPAGALGLMQLLPSTARYAARKAGIPYERHNLLNPETNIALGSRYLNQLLNEFNGNRILAAAAYNAGPHRVRQWLGDDQEKLPYDVWIETIPFRETRGYVQNVLSFSVIYGYRLGEQSPFITSEEAKHRL